MTRQHRAHAPTCQTVMKTDPRPASRPFTLINLLASIAVVANALPFQVAAQGCVASPNNPVCSFVPGQFTNLVTSAQRAGNRDEPPGWRRLLRRLLDPRQLHPPLLNNASSRRREEADSRDGCRNHPPRCLGGYYFTAFPSLPSPDQPSAIEPRRARQSVCIHERRLTVEVRESHEV